MNGIGFGPHIALLLDQFGQLVFAAWGEPGYQVGSSLTKPDWRDVDIRVMLDDAAFAHHFGAPETLGDRHNDSRWRAEMLAWSVLGERITGLPIDFQVEPLTEANEKWPSSAGRNPIGFRWIRGHMRSAFGKDDEP